MLVCKACKLWLRATTHPAQSTPSTLHMNAASTSVTGQPSLSVNASATSKTSPKFQSYVQATRSPGYGTGVNAPSNVMAAPASVVNPTTDSHPVTLTTMSPNDAIKDTVMHYNDSATMATSTATSVPATATDTTAVVNGRAMPTKGSATTHDAQLPLSILHPNPGYNVTFTGFTPAKPCEDTTPVHERRNGKRSNGRGTGHSSRGRR